jgi:hypothetical protein
MGTRYRVVVLTSWVRRVSVYDGDPLPRGGTDVMKQAPPSVSAKLTDQSRVSLKT